MIKMKPASYDSDEMAAAGGAGQIDELSARRQDLSGSEAGVSTPEHKQTPINGHYDPKQRLQYKLTFGFSFVLALVGLVLLCHWMLNILSGVGLGDAAGLTNLHPIMMYTFMLTLNMYSVLIYRTHFDRSKTVLKWAHIISMSICLVTSLLGVVAIFRAHALAEIPHWYSLHSWIGTLTMSLFSLQLIAGYTVFGKPGMSKFVKASVMPWHRFAGIVLLVLAASAILTGIAEMVIFKNMADYKAHKSVTFVVNFAGFSVIGSVIGVVYLLTEPKYLRPNLGEEQPLKR